jgi:hypothetical protein
VKALSKNGRYPNIASQYFGWAIGFIFFCHLATLKLQKKDAASIPNAVGKGKSYPSNNKKFAYPAIYPYFGQQLYQILYEVRNHQGAQKSARSKGGPIARGMSKCPFQISKSRNFSGIVPNSGVFRSRIYR